MTALEIAAAYAVLAGFVAAILGLWWTVENVRRRADRQAIAGALVALMGLGLVLLGNALAGLV